MFCRNIENMALYDYIVVGASSAGVAVARRLADAGSEQPDPFHVGDN